jgi:protoporphyrinogen oxidase
VRFDCSIVNGAERFWRRFQGREESVEEFVRRNLGAEVFERLIEPFCSGAYCSVLSLFVLVCYLQRLADYHKKLTISM